MFTRSVVLTLTSMLTAAAFANPIEEDQESDIPQPLMAGSGIGVPRASGMPIPSGVMHMLTPEEMIAALTKKSEIDLRVSPHLVEPRMTLAPSSVLTIDRRREGAGVFYRDDYSTYQLTNYSNPPSSFNPFEGQTNIFGFNMSADPWVGVANDAVMMTVPPGEAGGIPPVGVLNSTGRAPGEYLALARASGQDSITTSFALGMTYRYDTLTTSPAQPIILTDDWYLQSAETNQWWQPTSFVEGCVMDRVFFGGTDLGGTISFFENEANILDRFVSLGVLEGNFSIGQFYSAPRDPNLPFPVQEWFQLSHTLSISDSGRVGRGVWIKTPDSIANGFLDPRMADGDIVPSDMDPTGWVNIHPGLEDDPKTPMREGIGVATNIAGQRPPTNGYLGLTSLLAMITVSGNQFGEGLDPISEPSFQPSDAFIDNTTIIGAPYARNYLAPDHVIPLIEDFDEYPLNQVLRLSSDWWADSLVNNTLVTTASGGAGASLAQSHLMGDDIPIGGNWFDPRLEGLRTRPVVGDPLVMTARLRFDPSGDGMTRQLHVIPAGSILFGAVDPSAPEPTADGMIWIRQLNPDFDRGEEWQDHLMQGHWPPAEMWAKPPADAPLNTRYVRVPTGVAYPVNQFFELRIEIEPDPVSATAPPIMHIYIDDVELFPHGNSSSNFIADGMSPYRIGLYPVAQDKFNTDVLYIDDIVVDAPLRTTVDAPEFEIPYVETFSSYIPHETIDGYGDTPFLSLGSLPDNPPSQGRRMLTVIADPSAVPANGELVCRYMVETTFLDSSLFAFGDVVAISHDDLPAPFNTFEENNLDCPGAMSADTPFVIRAAPNTPRLETGRWALVDQNPTPFTEKSGDLVGYRYDTFNEPRWSVVDADSTVIRPLSEALGTEGPSDDQVVEIRNLFGVDGSSANYPMFTAFTSILPAAKATPPHNFANPESTAHLSFDLYVESVDQLGAPTDVLPPRARLSVPLMGVGGNSGRLTTIMFGGPHVNEHDAFTNTNSPVSVLAPDVISYTVPSGLTNPNVKFESTGISLLTGGAGLDGSITGPLVNRWIRVSASVNKDSEWSITIDEDRDGPLAPVTIATGVAIDKGVPFDNELDLNTTGFDGFLVNSGWDTGSGGEPLPRTARIVTLPGEEAAIAPSNADPFADYCFYQILIEYFIDDENPPLIAEPDESSGEIIEVRPLEMFPDVIAVLNRHVDGAGQVFGPRIHERCPYDLAAGLNQFRIIDSRSGVTRYEGRWTLHQNTPTLAFHSPKPAGGIAHVNGPAQDPPIAYNDPALAPPDYPAFPEARPILLATWADDEYNGWDPMPPVYPQQRWLIDNVRLEEVQLSPPCPDLAGDNGVVNGADLAQLLAAWGTVIGESNSDLNGDGIVNGSDLATLLANWGPCNEP